LDETDFDRKQSNYGVRIVKPFLTANEGGGNNRGKS